MCNSGTLETRQGISVKGSKLPVCITARYFETMMCPLPFSCSIRRNSDRSWAACSSISVFLAKQNNICHTIQQNSVVGFCRSWTFLGSYHYQCFGLRSCFPVSLRAKKVCFDTCWNSAPAVFVFLQCASHAHCFQFYSFSLLCWKIEDWF